MKIPEKLSIIIECLPAGSYSTGLSDLTVVNLDSLVKGQHIPYKDSSGLFSDLVVEDVGPGHVSLKYNGRTVILDARHGSAELAKDGRDYTTFWLNLSLD